MPRGYGSTHMDQTGLRSNFSSRDPWGLAERAAKCPKDSHTGKEEHHKQSKNTRCFPRILSKYPMICSSAASRCSPWDLKAFYAISSCKFVCWLSGPRHLFPRDIVSLIQSSLLAFVTLYTFPGPSVSLEIRAQEGGTD